MEEKGDAGELLKAQREYWDAQEASVDGMLGGLGFVHGADVKASRAFLDKVMVAPAHGEGRGRALDCGGGIGRVTKHVLIPSGFSQVDILDVSSDFLGKAPAYVQSDALQKCFCSGLAEFDFAAQDTAWNCIWVQWCAIYLADKAFVDFFRRAARTLVDDGKSVIVLKENVLRGDDDPPEPDEDDSSVTRSDKHLRRMFEEAGLDVVAWEEQPGFPHELYPVYMYALKSKAEAPQAQDHTDDGAV